VSKLGFGSHSFAVVVGLIIGYGIHYAQKAPETPTVPASATTTEASDLPASAPVFLAVAPTPAGEQPVVDAPKGWSLYFSPQGGAEKAVVDALASAKFKVRISIYVLSSPVIAKAIIDAQERGVDISVIMDSQSAYSKYSLLYELVDHCVTVRVDHAHATMHNKYAIIDESVVLTGSFNFTKSAELVNAENLLVIQDEKLAARFNEDWEHHLKHSKPPKKK